MANKLIHPRYHIFKTYIAETEGRISDESIKNLKTGVMIDSGKTAPAKVKLLKYMNNKSLVQISIYEGKNRQVRKMLESVGHSVRSLKRVSFGEINLDDLTVGSWKYLSREEIVFLKGNAES